MSAKPLFLDTSIQVSRKSSDENEINKINDILDKCDFICTSSFVQLEFKQSYIQDLVYLHKILVNEKTFSGAFLRTKKLNAHPDHRRKISNLLDAMGQFFANTNSFSSEDNFDKEIAEQMVIYLEIIIEDIWDWFESDVKHVSEDTGCVRSKVPPKKKGRYFDARIQKCKSEKIHCKLNKFFEEKQDAFKAILDYIKSLDDSEKKKPGELNKIVLTIEEGLKNPDNMCNSDQCKRLGDALIAVEAIHFKELFTKDVDQSKVICTPINLQTNLLN
ncbi:hypothetical protein SCALIN_C01_0038 [Candidatus Scalindua japonica]|uniref:Uncharacterized protein n=1 Tax=Candidatus Scalindua japonica TaxID=1284222 RepID=A0A286TT97_9BACT|nr:hypothetical protein [Candidatus Scalindua japonica]GAX59107.1 hypothetical protein SCALIN_C01_0038 [Candidatus Scalindua japonica]